ncbi:MAG TPA: carbon-nitrogen hydrolase family protein [Myxococcota bacterium]|nr:carbon-nitrogen hydrolase family protein [Myxococcota bacterium]
MAALELALLQMAGAGRDVAANRAKGEAMCREAAASGAHLALLPEMWSVGYSRFDADDADDVAAWRALAEPIDGPFVSHFRMLAAELGMAIGVTWLEAWTGAPRNAFALFDARGRGVLHYAKTHLCAWNPPDSGCTPGDAFPVAALETPAGPVEVGAMICFDREFPETGRLLMLGGAELILVPNACPLAGDPVVGDVRIAQFRGRAFELLLALAMTNYAAPQEDGHSLLVVPDGGVAAIGDESEGLVRARLDLDALRAWRRREAARDAARRPERYGPIADPRGPRPLG